MLIVTLFAVISMVEPVALMITLMKLKNYHHVSALMQWRTHMVRVLWIFLLVSRMCISNGRATAEFDDFTSVSTKGRAVVDYIAVSQECVQNCVKCEGLCMSDVIERYNLQRLIGLSCLPPDHSAISLSFSIDNVIDVPYDPATNFESNTHKRYRL